MSGAKHTPGPWRIVKDPRFTHMVVIERDEPECPPCHAYRVAHAVDVNSNPENAANAALIAAAPALLEALREFVPECQSMKLTEGERIAKARAAIAAAEGQQ